MPERPMTADDHRLRAFLDRNPAFELLGHDFLDRKATATLDWGDDRDELLGHLQARQRVARLVDDDETADRLLAKGLDSAQQVSATSEARFVREHGDLFEDEDAARRAHRRAVGIRTATQHLWANVRDVVASTHYRRTRFYNARGDLTAYFQEVPSYQDLFGSLDYLACPHCRSILSPAAYFVDLMRIADEYVTYPNTHKGSGNIPDGMRLEDRRPDLFTMPLTCESTDTLVRYLAIVNKVLEAKLADELEAPVFPALALAPYPFDLPFNLPLQQVRENLGALGTSLADVYATVGGPVATGQARGGTATTVQLAADASDRDGAYDGMEVALTTSAGAGQLRRVTAYDGASRTADVAPGWATPPAPGDRYEVIDALDVARERLGLSPEQYQMATTPLTSEADVAAAWGYADLAGLVPSFAPGAGRITFRAHERAVTGTGTHFDTDMSVGDEIWCGDEIRSVAAIAGPEALTVDLAWSAGAGDAEYQVARWQPGLGTVTVHKDGTQVIGAGTQFDRDVALGDLIQCAGQVRTVIEVRTATELLVDGAWGVAAAGAPYTVSPARALTRMTTFLARTGLDRQQVEALFRQGTSDEEFAAGVTQRFFVNATGEGLPPLQLVTDRSDPGNSFERVVGLSVARLDRLSRFVRLQGIVGWSAAQLDWLIASTGSNEIEAPVVASAAVAQRLAAASGSAVEVVSGLWHDMKTIGRVDEARPQDPFDRVYNPPVLLRGADPYTSPVPIPFDPSRPLTWNIDERTAGGQDADIRSRLLGALGLGDDDLTLVAHYVRALQGRAGGDLVLDLPTLSWLWRLARQAAWSGLTVDELTTLLWLLFYPAEPRPEPPPPGAVRATIATAVAVESAAAWLRASPFTVYDLRYVLTGEQSAYYKQGFTLRDVRTLVDGLAATTRTLRLGPPAFVFEGLRADGAEEAFAALVELGLVTPLGIVPDRRPTYDELASLFPFRPESFVTDDIDAAQSAEAFQALAGHDPPVLILSADGLTATLSETFTPDTSLAYLFPGDPDATTKQAEVREVLLAVRRLVANTASVLTQATAAQEDQAAQGVADFVGADRDLFAALVAFTTGQEDLAPQRVDLLTPLPAAAPVPDDVVALVTTLTRGSVWVRALGYTAAELAGVSANPAPFGIADTTALDLAAIQALERFRSVTVALDDRNGELFDYFRAPFADGVALLAELTGWPPAQIRLVADTLWPEPGGRAGTRSTVDGVARFQAAFDLASKTATDAFFLVDLMALRALSLGEVGGQPDETAWAAYEVRVGRTLDALRGLTGDGFDEAYEPVSGRVDEAKRDAMVGFTIWLLQPDFPFLKTPGDLYQLLLIDVEMSDCAMTSPIAQGISSVQLYLQRCRMGLEAGVTVLDVDPVWWEWLTAYRVWEANRKIFLYPENYVQPQLRSGQSPEYRRLVQALLQTDLNEASVSRAFLAYFDELDGLADLVPVAAHNANVGGPGDPESRLYVVGRPRTDPYTYYWRSHDIAHSWSPWFKIDLSITAPDIAPVYAFSRLFVFWNELDTGKTSTISDAKADPRFVRDAVLRYSFMTASDQWVQPQQLVAQVPTELGPNDYPGMLDKPAVIEALTPSAIWWQQPYPFRVARGLPGTGRVTVTEGLFNVDGADTHFTREVREGDRISIGGQSRIVGVVVDDRSLAVTTAWDRSAREAEYKVIPAQPNDNAFPSFEGSGRVSITQGLSLVTGDPRTRFRAEISAGDRILCANEVRTVRLVDTDQNMVVEPAWGVTRSDQTYVVIPEASGAEKLVVVLGGVLSTAADIKPVTPDLPPNPGRDNFLQQQDVFDWGLYYSASLAYEAARADPPVPGQVTLNYAAVLDQDLQIRDTRALLTNYQYGAANNPRPYQYRVDRDERLLRAAQSDNALIDNFWGNSAPGTPSLPKSSGLSRNLLYNIAAGYATLRNVGNQTGWAVFDNGDESFLVRSTEAGLQTLSDSVIGRSYPDVQLGEALLLSADAFTGFPSEFDELSFAFTRLTTSVVSRLRQRLFAGGIGRLLSVDSQLLSELPFNRFYATPTAGPPPHVIPPPERLDFDGAYGLYFQEIFLFCPWLIADRLVAENRFAEAKTWYEYVFNPTEQPSVIDEHPNDRYWRYVPFRRVDLDSLVDDLTDPRQIRAYNDDPFDPDAIARLRPAAYPKAVVLDYIDNLIRWGDFLFARDTSESINEATQLYVLAAELLGPRPEEVGVCPVPKTQNFAAIRTTYGQDIPQFLIDLENGLPAVMNGPATTLRGVPVNDIDAYFCVPENSELIGYWDRVDDRLFKIRHCMNLQGQVRQLALFEPPLDVHALVRARATSRGGMAPQRAVVAPIPLYRFSTILERAKAFTGTVIGLGGALLGALEKQDAEQLALLRTTQEAAVLELTVQMKELAVDQAAEAGQALEAVLASAETRKQHYRRLIDTDLSPEELANLEAMEVGLVFNMLASVAKTASSIAYTIPQVGSPFAMTYGGVQVGSALATAATVFEIGSLIAQFKAQKSLTMATYQRRLEDWELQLALAESDAAAATAQIAANDTQRESAQRDLRVSLLNVAQNREVQAFLERKFTNEQLYQWMAGRLSEVYFQAWLLALDLARSAERALQYELNTDRSFLDFVYWDSPRKGLLAGEGLGLALAQMEKAYLDGNVRALEIDKTVSLAQLDPRALLNLTRTGECTFSIPERLFDFDFPGHYCRKLRTISITIPAVTGPYQTVHATLTQLANAVVVKPDIEAIRYLLGASTTVPSPAALRSNVWVNQEIAVSRAINDTGMFRLDMNDPRYLPFEGTGAVSTWRLSMPTQTNRFDFTSISDVLIQLSYTALDGGEGLRRKVVAEPALATYVGSPLLSMAQLYSQDWYAFMTDHSDEETQTLRFAVPPTVVPPHLARAELVGFLFQLVPRAPGAGLSSDGREAATPYVDFAVTDELNVSFAPDPKGTYSHTFETPVDMAEVFAGGRTIAFDLDETPSWLKAGGFLSSAVVENIALILYYRATVNWTRPA